jgi:hypothetical protein
MSQNVDQPFSPNRAIDAAIREMLPHFSDDSQRRMKKAIRSADKAAQQHRDENTDAGARHIFREFIPASILNRSGCCFEYDVNIDGKTPDWFDADSKLLMDSYTYERGGSSPLLGRVKTSVATKCGTYRDIIVRSSLRFVVPVYLDFWTGTALEECLEERASFRRTFDDNNPALWAIMFFTEDTPGLAIAGQTYRFLCLTADDTFEQMDHWVLPSLCVYS